jgi:hypothetical protein
LNVSGVGLRLSGALVVLDRVNRQVVHSFSGWVVLDLPIHLLDPVVVDRATWLVVLVLYCKV